MHPQNRLSKPLKGGCFGHGKYELCTEPAIVDGLHGVRYFVIETDTQGVVSIGASKRKVIAGAHQVLRAGSEMETGERWRQLCFWSDVQLSMVASSTTPPSAGILTAARSG